MLITQVQLSDFRGVEALELQFGGRTTVLIGENGAGKTAILDAITQLLSAMLERLDTFLSPKLRTVSLPNGKTMRLSVPATVISPDKSVLMTASFFLFWGEDRFFPPCPGLPQQALPPCFGAWWAPHEAADAVRAPTAILSGLVTKASVPFREISRGDVSNGAYEAIIDLWVQERGLEPAEHRWRIHGPADELDLGAFQVKRLQPLVSHLDLLINDPLSSVPTIARYGVERRVNASLDSEPRDLDEETPRSLYADFLDATVLDYSGFFGWFRNREDLENELIREDRGYRDTPLSAVRSAISSLLPGFSRLRVRRASRLGVPDDFAHRKGPILLIDKGETTLSLDQLSHGEQGLIAMVGDIARRLAINNPTLENPLAGEGILLIDEIALHLHPRWQREVVPALERTFPSCQLILTTHSPQVIARVPRRDVRILEGGALLEDTPHTYGRSATAILSDLMDLPPHPEDIQRRLHEIAALIDKGDFDQARSRLDTLAESLGDQDAEIIRNRTLIEMLAE